MTTRKSTQRLVVDKGQNPLYEIRCLVGYEARIPKSTSILKQFDLDNALARYVIHGTLGTGATSSGRWKDSPHKALANLPDLPGRRALQEGGAMPIDPNAADAFVAKYGFLRVTTGGAKDSDDVSEAAVASDELRQARQVLRSAWEGDFGALVQIRKGAIESLVLDVPDISSRASMGRFKCTAPDLWSFACILFLKDFAMDKLGKCANPECRAPYFIRPRRTQTVCERRSCLDWAQRKFKSEWWKKQGSQKAAMERSKLHERNRE
jgi:hypothetical protein